MHLEVAHSPISFAYLNEVHDNVVIVSPIRMMSLT